MKNFYACVIIVLFGILFVASSSGVQQLHVSERHYAETKRESKDTTISFLEVAVSPDPTTPQLQKKGGVTISCSIVPFATARTSKTRQSVAYADPKKSGYDVFEVAEYPEYQVTPENVQFTINIKNNQDRVLKLSDVAIVMIVDGVQFSLPEQNLVDWKSALIVKGFEKNYTLYGPNIENIRNAKVVYFLINDVPTQYDQAGNIVRKENFEWYFQLKANTVQKEEVITYSYDYTPIHKEQCQSCSGRGYFEELKTCTYCNGAGKAKSMFDGKMYTCTKCNGSGRMKVQNECTRCHHKGTIEYPKSELPPITSQKDWYGWEVNVVTIPAGADVSVMDTKTGKFEMQGISPLKVEWYTCDSKNYPIIIKYNGNETKVLPVDGNGKSLGKVLVDFNSGSAVIKAGKRYHE